MAAAHEDPDIRRRAIERARRWVQVVAGMEDGTLQVGSRTPVAVFPPWVTLQVVHGGFATGEPAAGGPLRPHEAEAARKAGVSPQRAALFLHHLTDAGLADLDAMVESGLYAIHEPEQAALLSVAWLRRSGPQGAERAMALVEEIAPFADRLCFTPYPADAPQRRRVEVHRRTVGEVDQALAQRRPNQAIAAKQEALRVWNPFADSLLSHWLQTVESGQVAQRFPEDWSHAAARLLERYRELAAAHIHCSKHRKPGTNLSILRTALEETLNAGVPTPRTRGLLQHAVDSMLRRRGAPGSAEHAALRQRQATEAARPTFTELTPVLRERLGFLPALGGAQEVGPLQQPITDDEARRHGVPAGTEIPGRLRRIIDRCLSASPATLVESGVLPSAEELAGLIPQVVSDVAASAYPHEPVARLMGATYRAFRARRSLLLLNLEHQVRFGELPWAAALAPERDTGRRSPQAAADTLTELGTVALQGFPQTILPNPLIRELATLADQAGLDVPLTEELAADIFMGAFSKKFPAAARLAAEQLTGSLYARYYGIDYPRLRKECQGEGAAQRFAELCFQRAGLPVGHGFPARNGMVIEQAQILTTHNLAALVRPIGAVPAEGWADTAQRAFNGVCRCVLRVHNNTQALRAIKDAAYAWRQTLFFLTHCTSAEQRELAYWMERRTGHLPVHAQHRLRPVLAGLWHELDDPNLDDTPEGSARWFFGWNANGHWMLPRGQD
jgi:hypothetical protein